MTNTAPKVSVIIPLYNAEATIAASIRSVLDTAWTNLQIVVVDDASTDRGPDVVQKMFAALNEEGCDCLLHLSKAGANRGPAASRNLGIGLATGKYLAFLDADDLYLPGRFDRAIDLLEADSRLGAVFGIFRYELVSSDGRQQIRDISAKRANEQGRLTARDEHEKLLDQLLNGTIGLSTSTVTIRANVLRDLGMFPDVRFGEDQALWLRLLAVYPVQRVSKEPVSVYRIHEYSLCSRGQEQPEFIFGPILSRIDAITWLKRKGGSDEAIKKIARTVPGRVFAKFGRARDGSRELQIFMLRLLIKCPTVYPGIILKWNYWSIMLRLVLLQFRQMLVFRSA
ncbi:glycosyltransferase family 2 protein [Pseudomonadota bacterium]